MADQQLVEYIKNTLKKGFTQPEIERVLFDNGYSKDDVSQAFLEAYSNQNLNAEEKPKKRTSKIHTQVPIKSSKQKNKNNSHTKKVKSNKKYGLPIAAFVLSLIPVISLIGLILGIVSLVKIKKNPALKGKGFAIAALIISIINIILIIVGVLMVLPLFLAASRMRSFGGNFSYLTESNPISADSCASLEGFSKDMCLIKAAKDQGDVGICDSLSNSLQKKDCIQTVAIETKNPDLCSLIEDSAASEKCLSYVTR
ncbi:MAG: hypothetical protein MAG795_00814 [Candidatus Woesearchaeota archaeon]|nr:hypothetical protein [Candidatus Woesearchaeota archaeon]